MVFVCMVRILFDSGWFLFVHDSHIYYEPSATVPDKSTRASSEIFVLFATWERRILLELRNRRIHLVPRLCVRNKNIHLRFERSGVVQAARQQTDKERISIYKLSSSDTGSTFRTKTAFMFSTPDTWCEVVAQFSTCYSKGMSRNQECGSISTPSDMLAIAAMAFQHQGRFGLNFVANCAAHAPASDW